MGSIPTRSPQILKSISSYFVPSTSNDTSTYLFKLEYLSSSVLCLTLVAFHWKGWAFSL